jgi:hypothetical protein
LPSVTLPASPPNPACSGLASLAADASRLGVSIYPLAYITAPWHTEDSGHPGAVAPTRLLASSALLSQSTPRPAHPAASGRSGTPIGIESAAAPSSSPAARLAAHLSLVSSAHRAFRPRSFASDISPLLLSLIVARGRRPEHGASRSLLPTVPSNSPRCPASRFQPPHLTRLAADFASLAAEASVRCVNLPFRAHQIGVAHEGSENLGTIAPGHSSALSASRTQSNRQRCTPALIWPRMSPHRQGIYRGAVVPPDGPPPRPSHAVSSAP